MDAGRERNQQGQLGASEVEARQRARGYPQKIQIEKKDKDDAQLHNGSPNTKGEGRRNLGQMAITVEEWDVAKENDSVMKKTEERVVGGWKDEDGARSNIGDYFKALFLPPCQFRLPSGNIQLWCYEVTEKKYLPLYKKSPCVWHTSSTAQDTPEERRGTALSSPCIRAQDTPEERRGTALRSPCVWHTSSRAQDTPEERRGTALRSPCVWHTSSRAQDTPEERGGTALRSPYEWHLFSRAQDTPEERQGTALRSPCVWHTCSTAQDTPEERRGTALRSPCVWHTSSRAQDTPEERQGTALSSPYEWHLFSRAQDTPEERQGTALRAKL
ncbi:hypothetical protein NDU88_007787 [Pleurodeles waltl]|uniref:Uncharacterized protein n=1 Tax=Pleurodeles waltl TaxID=8319 RepID=A0AAV7STB4_PLEWA|nr:hypothetical protein NDU88_007787 [Pleurodeles waltl]